MTPRLGLNLLLVAAILASVAGAAVLLFRSSDTPEGVLIELPQQVPTSTAATPQPLIVVHVSGEVRNPGVYQLRPDSRANDALDAAGGPTDGADLDRVNLAIRLTDEYQLHIPPKQGSVHPAGRSREQTAAAPSVDILDLNTATVEELQSLPGIGPGRASAIVEYRRLNGPFERVEDLIQVTGIGEGILDSVRNLVEVR